MDPLTSRFGIDHRPPDLQHLMSLFSLVGDKGQYDLMLAIEQGGAPIAGENLRRFDDGKPRLEIEGYLWGVSRAHGSTAESETGRVFYRLHVIRRCDAATASLMSLLNRGARLEVTLSAYRAGGGDDVTPMLELIVDDAMLTLHTLLTGPGVAGPCEVLVFAGRKFEVRSAPQQRSGQRGAVRTCVLEPDSKV